MDNEAGIIIGAIIGIFGAPYFGLGYILCAIGYPILGIISLLISLFKS